MYGRRVRPASGLEQAEPLEAAADRGLFRGRRVDERQAEAADVVAEQVQRRLDRDRVRLHAQEVDRRAQLLVDRARAVDVARAEAA